MSRDTQSHPGTSRAFVALALLLASLVGCAAVPKPHTAAAGCASGADAASSVSLAPDSTTSDSLAFDVCVSAAGAGRVGSFHLELAYDSTLLRGAHVTPATGFVVSNPGTPGLIRIAGADAHGFAPGSIARVALARTAGDAGAVSVRVLELNDTTGASLLRGARVTGLAGGSAAAAAAPAPALPAPRVATPSTKASTPPAAEAPTPHAPAPVSESPPDKRPAGLRPLPPPLPALGDSAAASSAAVRIDSIVPDHVRLARGDVHEIELFGHGFVAAGNVVLFDGAEVATRPGVGGVIHFALPASLPSHAEAPPRQMTSGAHELRVRNAAGTSNAVRLIVESVP